MVISEARGNPSRDTSKVIWYVSRYHPFGDVLRASKNRRGPVSDGFSMFLNTWPRFVGRHLSNRIQLTDSKTFLQLTKLHLLLPPYQKQELTSIWLIWIYTSLRYYKIYFIRPHIRLSCYPLDFLELLLAEKSLWSKSLSCELAIGPFMSVIIINFPQRPLKIAIHHFPELSILEKKDERKN